MMIYQFSVTIISSDRKTLWVSVSHEILYFKFSVITQTDEVVITCTEEETA